MAEQVDLKLEFDQLRLPHFPVPDGETAGSWLRKECERGLVDRYPQVTDEIRHRLDYELGIIDRMGYSGYFLIVADFTRFAREQGIYTTCRGSAPGSIVTYSLGITPVDPLAYGLPFERFLNPDRVTMPDIDIDFQDSRRDEVIEYVTRKYGDDRVAQIITFGTLGAKAAIRDVGRAMGLTYAEADRVAKAVPNELNISLERAVETSPQLRELIAGDERVDKLIGVAKQLEGVARHASTHAAGIVISREPLTEIMPLQRATDGRTTMTQFEMHACEALGLLKFDFLGLINLTILADAVALIRDHRGVEIDVDNLPLDDTKTFELLSTGETTGIFQLEGSGMRRYVKDLKPTEVRDLAAMVALFRPGPMANIPAYIRRKHGEEAGHLPARIAGAGAARHLRDLRLPGRHHDRRHRHGRLHRPRGGQPLLRDSQEEGIGPPRARGQVQGRRQEEGHPAVGGGPGVRRLRAVRSLRVQQGPRHLLRADRVPDRLSQGQLSRRVHDRGAERLPGARREGGGGGGRVPAAGDRGPAAGRAGLGGAVHGGGRRRWHLRHPFRPGRHQERGRGRDRGDRGCAGGTLRDLRCLWAVHQPG